MSRPGSPRCALDLAHTRCLMGRAHFTCAHTHRHLRGDERAEHGGGGDAALQRDVGGLAERNREVRCTQRLVSVWNAISWLLPSATACHDNMCLYSGRQEPTRPAIARTRGDGAWRQAQRRDRRAVRANRCGCGHSARWPSAGSAHQDLVRKSEDVDAASAASAAASDSPKACGHLKRQVAVESCASQIWRSCESRLLSIFSWTRDDP